MSYEVLYRKWRPRGFDAFVGQEHVRKALAHALDHDRLHHAYLFTGTRGVGKTTVARIFARCLNCDEGVSSTPCGVCSSCTQILAGRFVDLIEVDAASRTRIDDTRELLDNVQYAPTAGRYKVYLIDEVHMLSTASFNALLKTLEEPPPRIVFLLATTDPRKLPVTVLSRCQQFNLKNYPTEHVAAHLRTVLSGESIAAEEGAIALLARAARGSMRDALSLTDQAIAHGAGSLRAADVAALLGTVDHQALARVLQALAAGDGGALMSVCRDLATFDVDHEDVLARLAEAIHDIAVMQQVAAATPRSELDTALIAELAATLSPERIQLWYQIAILGGRDLPLAPDGQVGLEMTLLRMLAFEPVTETPEGSSSPRSVGPATSGQPRLGAGGGPSTASPARPAASRPSGPPAGPASVSTVGPRTRAATEPDATAARMSPPARSAAASSVSTPASTTVSRSAPAAPDQSDAAQARSSDWAAMVSRLQLDGMARALCMHASAKVDADDWLLTLAAESAGLLSEPRRLEIQGALAACVGRPVQVRLQVGALDGETPAQIRERLAQVARAQALAAFKADRKVQSLVASFGGTLDEDSVRATS